jgi:hypothetical protein
MYIFYKRQQGSWEKGWQRISDELAASLVANNLLTKNLLMGNATNNQ